MNFSTFPVATTTIFPISNSVAGGQLVTEWNLRSRDFVSSDMDVEYDFASSYVHAADDFEVRVQQDDTGVIISNSTIEILPGTAILNGHYVKQEAHMLVDLLEANNELKLNGLEPLTGKLAVGLRVYYSTESSMVGAMMPENDEDVYEGVQIVVLPEYQLKTPKDSPKDEAQITCHLKLATFTFLDNEIRGVVNNVDKVKYVDARRISNIEDILDENYLSKGGINPKKLYVLAGKSYDNTVNDTWCDATDSLMVWDKNPQRTKEAPSYDTAQFVTKLNGTTSLVIPHKNVDGMKASIDPNNPDYNVREYYQEVQLDLPVADFSTNTSGTVDYNYTKRIKNISSKVDKFFKLLKGKQVAYIETLNKTSQLPPINDNWQVGDYTLVDVDNYALAAEGNATYTRAPSTLYAVLPGTVKAVKFHGKGDMNSNKVPEGLNGVQIGSLVEKSEAPIQDKISKDEDLKLQGLLGNNDLKPGTVTYTTPEGIVYKDDAHGTLVYSEEDNDDSDGNPRTFESSIAEFQYGNSDQLCTIASGTAKNEQDEEFKGYYISVDGRYLTVGKQSPYKLYFSDTLTPYGLFAFVYSDNQSLAKIDDIKTEGIQHEHIRPIEIVCTQLVDTSMLSDINLLTDVQDLIKMVNKLTSEKDEKGDVNTNSVLYIKTLVDAVTEALSKSDADTATSLASELKDTVDKVFDSDTYKDTRDLVDSAKKAVETAASKDTSSVQEKIEAVNTAYKALETFVTALDNSIETLQDIVDKVREQLKNVDNYQANYSMYGRLTAYYNEGDSGTFGSSLSYIYVSVNKDMQEQMWQVLETGSLVSIFNSYYGYALTKQDVKELKETTYSIDYENGSISGLPMIGYAQYSYYSTNILQDLLNYFSVTDETHGVAGEDYFIYRYRIDESNYQDYYYVVTEEGSRSWSDPIWLTGSISLATTQMIGGFLNVPDTALDGGYVKLNDEGYLQLVDYSLLRTGAAAYQLGEDIQLTAGLASADIQTYLDEYVNDRVAFPNSSQIAKAKAVMESGTSGVYTYPEVIHVTVNITAEESQSNISISNIDSRFNGSVFLHITGSANSNNIIRLTNIEKLRIDQNIQYDESDPPTILIDNCGLYYDAEILNKIAYCNSKYGATGMSSIRFWYQKYEDTDPDIVINDMTVSEINAPKITDVIDFWNAKSPNDNHYHVSLHSLTFANDGTVQGAGILVANDSTSNIQDGHIISAAEFKLPQGVGLNYPVRLITKPLKFTGTFESGYMTDSGYVMQDTNFSALTQCYDVYNNSSMLTGSILFHVDVNLIAVDFGGISTEAWEPDTFHLFQGTAI